MRTTPLLFGCFVAMGATCAMGCGARTGDDFFYHPDVDASMDTHVEPTGCPTAEPTSGTRCGGAMTCSYAAGKCGPDIARCLEGVWLVGSSCTTSCPPAKPAAGGACGVPAGTTCSYPSSCGGVITARCSGTWTVVDPGCGTPCPAIEPRNGDACGPTPTKCNWTSACGGNDFGGCDGKRWSITLGECPCPGARPSIGAACATEGQKCSWTNFCKTTDTGVCSAGKWKLDIQPCGTCPVIAPPTGSACSTGAGCKYYPGTDFCNWQCACDGAHWSCGPC